MFIYNLLVSHVYRYVILSVELCIFEKNIYLMLNDYETMPHLFTNDETYFGFLIFCLSNKWTDKFYVNFSGVS